MHRFFHVNISFHRLQSYTHGNSHLLCFFTLPRFTSFNPVGDGIEDVEFVCWVSLIQVVLWSWVQGSIETSETKNNPDKIFMYGLNATMKRDIGTKDISGLL